MSEHTIEAEIEKNYRFNFIVNLLDGTFFWSGGSFIAATTILPLYVSHLTNNTILIGLIPTLGSGGWLIPQLFTANWVQQLPQKKVAPVKIGLVSERLPLFIMALTAWLLYPISPTLALIAFFVTYGWHAVGAGVIAVAWQDMIAKIFSVNRRGRFFGISNFTGLATGVLGASAATLVLSRYEFPTGYVLCFAAAAIFIFISWIFLSLTREPSQPSREPKISQREYWKKLPNILREDYNFRRFLITRLVIGSSRMATGFLAVYAVDRWALADSQAGNYTTVLLIGQAIFNLVFGSLADKKGHKLVIEISLLISTATVILAAIAQNPFWFYIVFGLVGASTAGFIISGLMIAFEFSEPELRPTYIGMNSTVNGIVTGIAPIFGGWLALQTSYQVFFWVTSAIGLCAFVLLHWWVKEPREV